MAFAYLLMGLSVWVVVVTRFGLVIFMALLMVSSSSLGAMAIVMVSKLALGVFGFYTATRGRVAAGIRQHDCRRAGQAPHHERQRW